MQEQPTTRRAERAVYVEFRGALPFTVITLETKTPVPGGPSSTYLLFYDVENCGTVDEPDLYHDMSGDRHVAGFGDAAVELGRYFPDTIAAPDFVPDAVWWDPTIITVTIDGEPVDAAGTSDGLLASSGYRRLAELPDDFDPANPFADMCEGQTVYCSVCDRRFSAGGHMEFPAASAGRPYDLVRAATGWAAAWAIRNFLDEWDAWKDGGTGYGWRVGDAYRDRLDHEAEVADATYEQSEAARKDLPDRVRHALAEMASELEDAAGVDEAEHLCPHLWWSEGIGWTGPGADA